MQQKFYWMTTYKIKTSEKNESEYGAYVIAENELVAKALLKLRGMGEVISSMPSKVTQVRRFTSLAKLYKQRNLGSCLHTLCFLGNVAINAQLMTHTDFLLDCGVIHDIMHELDFPQDFGFRKHVYKKLLELDKLAVYLGY